MVPDSTDSPAFHRRRYLIRAVAWLLAATPVIWMALLMKRYLVNVPFMDDYVWLPFYEKIARHEFTFRDFFFVQMEHRLTVPCFLAWLCNHLRPGQITLHNWISYSQMLLTLIGLAVLMVQTGGIPQGRRMPVLILASWIVFSPGQFSTILWADCFSSFLPTTFLTATLVVFHSRLKLLPKLVLCIVGAILSSHSFASGILIWFLLTPLITWSDALADGRERRVFAIAWGVAMAAILGLYFRGLTNQAAPEFSYHQGHEETLTKHLGAFLGNPLASARFVLIFAGALLGRGTFLDLKDATLVIGVALATVLAAAILFTARHFKERQLRTRALPWLMLGAYTFGTGAMVGMGRLYASINMDGALWNRYATHDVPLLVAVIVLICILVPEWSRRISANEERVRMAQAGVFGGFVVLLLCGWGYGLKQMEAWNSSRLRDATCQIFGKALDHRDIDGPTTGNLEFAQRMDDIGLLRPAMLKNRQLKNFSVSENPLSTRTARVDVMETSGHRKFETEGFAFLPGHDRVADGIFLTYRDAANDWIIFAVGQVKEQPMYLNRFLSVDMQFLHQPYKSFRHTYGAFNVRFDIDNIPPGRWEIAVWAFDFRKQTARRISGKYRLDTARAQIVEFGDGSGMQPPRGPEEP